MPKNVPMQNLNPKLAELKKIRPFSCFSRYKNFLHEKNASPQLASLKVITRSFSSPALRQQNFSICKFIIFTSPCDALIGCKIFSTPMIISESKLLSQKYWIFKNEISSFFLTLILFVCVCVEDVKPIFNHHQSLPIKNC